MSSHQKNSTRFLRWNKKAFCPSKKRYGPGYLGANRFLENKKAPLWRFFLSVFFSCIFILLNLYYILSHGTAYIRQRNHLHSKSHLKDIIPWSLQPCLTRHLLRSSFINIICLKFLSRFLLLFPHMPNIALSSGVHLSRSSFSPCDISHEIFLKIHIQTSVRQLWYHHANRQGSPHLSLISL